MHCPFVSRTASTCCPDDSDLVSALLPQRRHSLPPSSAHAARKFRSLQQGGQTLRMHPLKQGWAKLQTTRLGCCRMAAQPLAHERCVARMPDVFLLLRTLRDMVLLARLEFELLRFMNAPHCSCWKLEQELGW